VKINKEDMRCILLYAEKTVLPMWYSNTLLSNESRSVLGNVLLVHQHKDWAEENVVPADCVAVMMQADENSGEVELNM